ncbi:rhombosortase [Pelagibius sp. Alg239-R121]|uniref:rhombosortase n=1 Tax=Pelagibius sp. Alg239-R121 TaxID=2993448 RepID=UPI0024A6BD18|nr:rhombosortase [Pelagibius sp. Alg239-R121]
MTTASRGWKSHDSLALPWFSLVLAALAAGCFVVFGPAPDLLVWDRAGIDEGEFWRGVTGHFAHSDVEHLVWNLAALSGLAGLLECKYGFSAAKQFSLLAVSAIAISAVVYCFRPNLVRYVGLSGILNGYFILLLWHVWQEYRHPTTPLVALGVIGKVVFEAFAERSLFGVGDWPPVPEAHAAGVVTGILFVAVSACRRST